MANCDFCKKKMGFMEAQPFFVGITPEDTKNGTTYQLCANCIFTARAAMRQDEEAKKSLNNFAQNMFVDAKKRQDFMNFFDFADEVEKKRKEEEQKKQQELFDYRSEKIESIMAKVAEYKRENPPIFDLVGCRGRSMKVYEDRAVITTDATLGAILSNNATDGEKTIFYHDVVGIQYKKTGLTIGYLQMETSSGQMNNKSSNAFSENTFTFESADIAETMDTVKEYIIWKVSQYKKK